MSRTSAYKTRIRTGSADTNALMLLNDGELIAILVELADEGHGDDRGKWIVETTFGVHSFSRTGTFAKATDAANWVSEHICDQPFDLGVDLVELS